jgi:hypothetical protein
MAKKTKKRERTERRFLPQSTTPPTLVKVIGGIGAAALGGGLFGQYGRPEAVPYSIWVMSAGALFTATAVWIGSSGDPALRVGDGGIAIEKGGLRRIPWWGIDGLAWEDGRAQLVVDGADEAGARITVRVGAKSQPQAAAWIVKEARARIPDKVQLNEEVGDSLPKASRDAGQVIKLEPVQVVGRHCAESGKVIAYEPDARVCPRCERVFHKSQVPESCPCGGSLDALRKKPAEASA